MLSAGFRCCASWRRTASSGLRVREAVAARGRSSALTQGDAERFHGAQRTRWDATRGSPAHNVIPKRAKATVNVRVDPGERARWTRDPRIKGGSNERTSYELAEVSEPSPIAPFVDDGRLGMVPSWRLYPGRARPRRTRSDARRLPSHLSATRFAFFAGIHHLLRPGRVTARTRSRRGLNAASGSTRNSSDISTDCSLSNRPAHAWDASRLRARLSPRWWIVAIAWAMATEQQPVNCIPSSMLLVRDLAITVGLPSGVHRHAMRCSRRWIRLQPTSGALGTNADFRPDRRWDLGITAVWQLSRSFW